MIYGTQQDENSVSMNLNVSTVNMNVKGATSFETVLVEPTLPTPVRDSFQRNDEMESSSSSWSTKPPLPFRTSNVNVSVTDKDKQQHAKEESFASCLATVSTQEPKTKFGVTVTAVPAATATDEINKKEKETPSRTDGRQQEQELVVTRLNPATDIVLIPFTKAGSDSYNNNNNKTHASHAGSDSDTLLHNIVCDYMEDVWSAGSDEDRILLWQDIAAKVRFLVPLTPKQLEQAQKQKQKQMPIPTQAVQFLSLSKSQQEQQCRFRKPNRRLPLCFQVVQPVGDPDQPNNNTVGTGTDTENRQHDDPPNHIQYRVLSDAENNARVHSFLTRAFGLEETEELPSPAAARTARSVKAPAASTHQQQSHNNNNNNNDDDDDEGRDDYKTPKSAPRRASDGTYNRPRGRPLLGYNWDKEQGLWFRVGDSKGKATAPIIRRASEDGSYPRPCGWPLLGYDWDSQQGLWIAKVERGSENENDSDDDSDSAGDGDKDSSLLMDETRRKSTRFSSTSKVPIDALSMADISHVAALLGDMYESSSLSMSVNDNQNKKSNKKTNKTGASITTTKSPANRSRRPVLAVNDGARRKPPTVKVQVNKEDAYGPVLQVAPKVSYHRYQDGTYVRPRGRAPSGKVWDVIRGVWVAIIATTTTSSTSTAEPARNDDTNSNGSSRTLGSEDNDDDSSSDMVDGGHYSSGNNECRGEWVGTSLKAKTATLSSRQQPDINERHKSMTAVNANVSAKGNGFDKENAQGHVQPRHGRPAFRVTTSNMAAAESKPSAEEAFLAYRNSHPRQHRYSTERSNGLASAATTATAALKKRRESSDVLDLSRRNQDKRRRQNSSVHAAKKAFPEKARTGYNTSDQRQGEFPKSLGMAPSGVPMVLPAEEYGRHGGSRFERSTEFGLPDSIPLVPGPFGSQPMLPSQIQSFDYPTGSNLFDTQLLIQNMVRLNNIDMERARSSTNMSFVHVAVPLPDINDLLSHLESAPWSCVLRRRLAETSCPFTRARLYASLSRVERAEPYLVHFLWCLHQNG